MTTIKHEKLKEQSKPVELVNIATIKQLINQMWLYTTSKTHTSSISLDTAIWR